MSASYRGRSGPSARSATPGRSSTDEGRDPGVPGLLRSGWLRRVVARGADRPSTEARAQTADHSLAPGAGPQGDRGAAVALVQAHHLGGRVAARRRRADAVEHLADASLVYRWMK